MTLEGSQPQTALRPMLKLAISRIKISADVRSLSLAASASLSCRSWQASHGWEKRVAGRMRYLRIGPLFYNISYRWRKDRTGQACEGQDAGRSRYALCKVTMTMAKQHDIVALKRTCAAGARNAIWLFAQDADIDRHETKRNAFHGAARCRMTI